jgi:polyribonucleotide nucleotidyltransferase
VVNPTSTELRTKSKLNLLVAGSEDAIVMVESGAAEIPEAEMVRALTEGHAVIRKIVELQKELRARVGRPKRTVAPKEIEPGLRAEVEAALGAPLLEAMRTSGKLESYSRMKQVRDAYLATIPEEESGKRATIPAIYDGLREKLLRT